LGVSQNESVHPQLESQPSPDENPESQQTLGYNLKRMIAIKGTPALLKALQLSPA
jgi:hypothetical protein